MEQFPPEKQKNEELTPEMKKAAKHYKFVPRLTPEEKDEKDKAKKEGRE